MGNGRGSWNQHYRESISDSCDAIVSLNLSILDLEASNKATSIFDYFKSSYRQKQKKINEEIKELEDKITQIRKSIKSDQLEMYD